MTTTYAFTGNIKSIVGTGATGINAALGTNLGEGTALVDLDNSVLRLPERAPVELAADGTFSESLIASNSAGINILDGNLRYILYLSWRDAQGKRRDWNSGYFALTTNTDLKSVAGTDVAIEVDQAAAMVATLVQQEIENHTPGIDLGSTTRTSNAMSTTVVSTNAAGDIANLSLNITGQGRPVDVRFHAPGVYHSTANALVSVILICNNNVNDTNNQIGTENSPLTNNGPSMSITRRTGVLAAGASYTFKVRLWGAVAGTSTLVAASFCPIELTVTSR